VKDIWEERDNENLAGETKRKTKSSSRNFDVLLGELFTPVKGQKTKDTAQKVSHAIH